MQIWFVTVHDHLDMETSSYAIEIVIWKVRAQASVPNSKLSDWTRQTVTTKHALSDMSLYALLSENQLNLILDGFTIVDDTVDLQRAASLEQYKAKPQERDPEHSYSNYCKTLPNMMMPVFIDVWLLEKIQKTQTFTLDRKNTWGIFHYPVSKCLCWYYIRCYVTTGWFDGKSNHPGGLSA